jgi:hypothetical protein
VWIGEFSGAKGAMMRLCVVLDVGGEVAEILRFLSIREIRGHLEHFGTDHSARSYFF